MSRSNRSNRFVPTIEVLEDRRLMTTGVTAMLKNNVLTLRGTDAAIMDPIGTEGADAFAVNDRISVYQTGANDLNPNSIVVEDAGQRIWINNQFGGGGMSAALVDVGEND